MSVIWPTIQQVRVVLISARTEEASQLGRLLKTEQSGSLIQYDSWADFIQGPPRLSSCVLAIDTELLGKGLDQAVEIVRRRLPSTGRLFLIGSSGGGAEEIAARSSGAGYLVRPVHPETWLRILSEATPAPRAVGQPRQVEPL